MSNTNNKVKFGLKNCHYAKATLDPDTNAVTFGTPVAIRLFRGSGNRVDSGKLQEGHLEGD